MFRIHVAIGRHSITFPSTYNLNINVVRVTYWFTSVRAAGSNKNRMYRQKRLTICWIGLERAALKKSIERSLKLLKYELGNLIVIICSKPNQLEFSRWWIFQISCKFAVLVVCMPNFLCYMLMATPSAFSFSRLPFGILGASILAPWVTILAPREHPGGPREQQDGHVGVPESNFILRFGIDVGTHCDSFVGTGSQNVVSCSSLVPGCTVFSMEFRTLGGCQNKFLA